MLETFINVKENFNALHGHEFIAFFWQILKPFCIPIKINSYSL